MFAAARLRFAFALALGSLVALLGAAAPAAAQSAGDAIDNLLDSADYLDGWRSSATLTRDAEVRKLGPASLKSVGSQTDRFKKTFTNPVNASQHRFLAFWYFIDDPSKITGGQVEITSAGVADQQEYNWSVLALHLQRGWNYVVLDLPGRTTGDMPIDLTRINYFRIYHQNSASVTTRIDEIIFTNRSPNSFALAKFFDNRRLATGPEAIEAFDPWLDSFDSTSAGAERDRFCRKQRVDLFHRQVVGFTIGGFGVSQDQIDKLNNKHREAVEHLCGERTYTRAQLVARLEDRAEAEVAIIQELANLFGLTLEAAAEMYDRALALDLERIFAQCGTRLDELERYIMQGTTPSGIVGRNVLIRNCATSSANAAPSEIATLIRSMGPAVVDRKAKLQQCMAKFAEKGSECDNPYASSPDDRYEQSIRSIKGLTTTQKDQAIQDMRTTLAWIDATTASQARQNGFETHPRTGAPNPTRLEVMHQDFDRRNQQIKWLQDTIRDYHYMAPDLPPNATPEETRAHRERDYADHTRLYDKLKEIQLDRQRKGNDICADDKDDPICKDFIGPERSATDPPQPKPETARCAAYAFKDGSRAWYDRSKDSNGSSSQTNEGDRIDHCLCELFDKGYVDALPGNEFAKQLGGCPTPEEHLAQRCLDDPKTDDGRMKPQCLFILRPASQDKDGLGAEMCEVVMPDCDKNLLYTKPDGSCGCGQRNPTTGRVLIPQCTSVPNCEPFGQPTASGCGCQPFITGGNACTAGGRDFYLTENPLNDLKVRRFPDRPAFANANILMAKEGDVRIVTPAIKRNQLFNDTTLQLRAVLPGASYTNPGELRFTCSNTTTGLRNHLIHTTPISTLAVGGVTTINVALSSSERAACYGTDANSNVHFEIFVDSKLGQPVGFFDILGDLGNIKPACVNFPPRPSPGPRPLSIWPDSWTFGDGFTVNPQNYLPGFGPIPTLIQGPPPGTPIPNPPVCVEDGVPVPCPN